MPNMFRTLHRYPGTDDVFEYQEGGHATLRMQRTTSTVQVVKNPRLARLVADVFTALIEKETSRDDTREVITILMREFDEN